MIETGQGFETPICNVLCDVTKLDKNMFHVLGSMHGYPDSIVTLLYCENRSRVSGSMRLVRVMAFLVDGVLLQVGQIKHSWCICVVFSK